MYLSQLTARELRRATRLLKRKEVLEVQHANRIAKLNAEIEKIGVGRKKGRPRTRPVPVAKARTRRSDLTAKIIEALTAAQATGLTVKELAEKIKTKPESLYSWFYSTGKKISGLKKSKDGRYVYEG